MLLKYFLIFQSLVEVMSQLDRYRFIGKHLMSQQDENGKELANEFQLINPQLIQIADKTLLNGATYEINNIFPTVIRNDDVVTVSFYSSNPASSDWIGAYSPANVDITTTVPVKYGWCDEMSTYLANSSVAGAGTGQLTFNMTNLRSDIAFYYFANALSKPVLVAKSSQVVTFENFNQPLRPRIVATGDPDVLKLLWSSASSSAPTLQWGLLSGSYKTTVTAVTSTIEKSSMCGAPANTTGWRELGLIHTAEFVGLTELANTPVFYHFGDATTNDWSQEFKLFGNSALI